MRWCRFLSRHEEKERKEEKSSEKSWTVHAPYPLSSCFCLLAAKYKCSSSYQLSKKRAAELSVWSEMMSSSSSLVSAISASPSATAKARLRHDDAATATGAAAAAAVAARQLKTEHGGCCCCRSRGRAVVARAGPGPLTEIEPDLNEDPIDKWRTNGVSPVCPPRRRRPPCWEFHYFSLFQAVSMVSLILSSVIAAAVLCCLKKWFWHWKESALQDDFEYGVYDGHHTYNETQGSFSGLSYPVIHSLNRNA